MLKKILYLVYGFKSNKYQRKDMLVRDTKIYTAAMIAIVKTIAADGKTKI